MIAVRLIMKEKHKYHIADIANIIVFCCVFTCLFVGLVIGVVHFAQGILPVNKLIYRFTLTLLMCVPFLIKKIFKITFSRVVSSVYYGYVFMAGFLGVVLEFYHEYFWWDMFIHFLMGVVLSVLSIYILNYTVYKKDKSYHNLFFTFLFMLLFAMGVSALWEMFEFVGDLIFNAGFQRYVTYEGIVLVGKEAIFDTMIDLTMDFLGAVVGIVFTVVMIKIDKRFLKTFNIKKLRSSESEVEDMEE